MKRSKKLFFYLSFVFIITLVFFNCQISDDPGGHPKPVKTGEPGGPNNPPVIPTATPVVTAKPYTLPAELSGYWRSVFGDGFEITEPAFTSGNYLFYQYDDDLKNVSFSGEIVNVRTSGSDSGYITIRITDTGSWGKTPGEYYVVHWQNLSDGSIEESCAYKTAGEDTIPTLDGAEDEFSLENDYFLFHAAYNQQKKVQMPVPSVFTELFPQNAFIPFSSSTAGAVIFTGISNDIQATTPDTWVQADEISLNATGTYRIFARASKTGLADSQVFTVPVTVVAKFLPATGQPGSDAVFQDDAAIVAWATGYRNYQPGGECAESWQTPEKALGKAVGDSYDIVCLGNGGEITLTFDRPITDGAGADFAVFENSFNDTFLELAYVEVSSNGADFIRFDCASLTASPVEAFGSVQPAAIHGLAGKYKQGYGTPFDLASLKYREEVRNGTVDLTHITYIRLVDILGNPTSGITDYDSFGHIIYDPYKCVGSGGFDLDAVAVLNQQ